MNRQIHIELSKVLGETYGVMPRLTYVENNYCDLCVTLDVENQEITYLFFEKDFACACRTKNGDTVKTVNYKHEDYSKFGKIEEYEVMSTLYMKNGKLHREDGPAVEWPNGRNEWWINGIRLSVELED